MAKKEKLKKVFLKLKRAHKSGFRLGSHIIKMGPAREFSLTEKEFKELKGKGPQAWIQELTKAQAEAGPISNAENKKMQDAKKQLVELGVELTGEESLEDLEALKDTVEMMVALRKILDEKEISYEEDATIEELEALLPQE